jgi:hypothetical protein
MANNVERAVMKMLRRGLGQKKEAILSVFRAFTPGNPRLPSFANENQPRHPIGPDTEEHVHPVNNPEAADTWVSGGKEHPKLYEAWEFVESPGGLRTVAFVINSQDYAELVEYGWITKTGYLIPGHYMATSAMASANVQNIYAEIAGQALIVGMTQGAFKSSASKSDAAQGRRALKSIGKGRRADQGFRVYFKKGRIRIQGIGGRGLNASQMSALAEAYADRAVELLNGE